MAQQYKVTILLTKYGDPFSRFVKFMGKSSFTHASISLDPDENEFYSFNLKGFVKEQWKNKTSKHLLPGKAHIYFYVNEHVYQNLQEEIRRFEAKKAEMTYSVFGTLLCLFHIPHHFKRHYFCSRFIAEVLHNSGATELKRAHSLYLPVHFLNELKPYMHSVTYGM